MQFQRSDFHTHHSDLWLTFLMWITFRWMSPVLTDDTPTLVQVMAWCCQATSHHLNQCWPRSMSPNGVARPQWVNAIFPFGPKWKLAPKFIGPALKLYDFPSLFWGPVTYKIYWSWQIFTNHKFSTGLNKIFQKFSTFVLSLTFLGFLNAKCLNDECCDEG